MGASLGYCLKSEYLSLLSDQAIPQARSHIPPHALQPLLNTVLIGPIVFAP
jgi:hypothetical protein